MTSRNRLITICIRHKSFIAQNHKRGTKQLKVLRVKRNDHVSYSMEIPTSTARLVRGNEKYDEEDIFDESEAPEILNYIPPLLLEEITAGNILQKSNNSHLQEGNQETLVPGNYNKENPSLITNEYSETMKDTVTDIPMDTDVSIDERDNEEKINSSQTRTNEINVQMISKSLHEQLFNNASKKEVLSTHELCSVKKNLGTYGIDVKTANKLPDVDIKLPPLEGNDIEEHFYNIANAQVSPYLNIITKIIKDIPEMPKEWVFKEGWTRYTANDVQSVDFPLEDGIVFDIEVCMKEGPLPTIATAVTDKAWYSWVSKTLTDDYKQAIKDHNFPMDMLIPMESKASEYGQKLNHFQKKPKIIVGHNVSFDRSRIKEQYWLNCTGSRFIDTMSLHVCVSGINSYQRSLLSSKKEDNRKDDYIAHTSLNSLTEVHKLYCGTTIDKAAKSIFLEGTLSDVKENFNTLMNYCATDVVATHNVLSRLFPIFRERFPHPVTLAGMLELGTAYLPVNSGWQRYLEKAESTFEDLNYEAKFILAKRADAVCRLMHNEKYKEDLWMWDQDWSTQEIKFKKPKPEAKDKTKKELKGKDLENQQTDLMDNGTKEYLPAKKSLLPAKIPYMQGYPAWYRKLCPKLQEETMMPDATNISSSMLIVPKLLNLTWENYPLHYIRGKGWGILVPYNKDPNIETKVPIKQLLERCPVSMSNNVPNEKGKKKEKERKRNKKEEQPDISKIYQGTAIWCDTDIDNCCYFFKLPHKDGPDHNVGNPLAKDFLNKFSENVLASVDVNAMRILKVARMMSYWRNNRDRIRSQLVSWFDDQYFPKHVSRNKSYIRYGAIIPQVIVSGTLTRRAVEPTWMTASNAHTERIGSELRAMIQAPPGYNIVGADVDSQELWIASIIGDAYYKKIHGASPFGWMTIIGNKANGTDMHSVTAKAIGISRDHAKIINYARIYGAGQKFAEQLLKQFNPSMTDVEAASKSRKMFALTKGKRMYTLKPEYVNDHLKDKLYTASAAYTIAKLHGKLLSDMFTKSKWEGGSESAMFNRLEEIANSTSPVTPFLGSRLTRALENVKDSSKYLPTKVNWVVQSGAVDFLHLMLVSMRWLMKDNARFCLSFHDEVRYLVPSKYKYNAALAMHVTNLLTRSFCSSRLGMYDLPMSVAFFTSVEVDTVLRKESSHDCKTPSNPHGLQGTYNVPPGESLDIWTTLEKSGGSLGPWHNTKQ